MAGMFDLAEKLLSTAVVAAGVRKMMASKMAMKCRETIVAAEGERGIMCRLLFWAKRRVVVRRMLSFAFQIPVVFTSRLWVRIW